MDADRDAPRLRMGHRVTQRFPPHKKERPVGIRVGGAFAHNFGLDLNSVLDPQFARQIKEKVNRRFGSVGVTPSPQTACLASSRLLEA